MFESVKLRRPPGATHSGAGMVERGAVPLVRSGADLIERDAARQTRSGAGRDADRARASAPVSGRCASCLYFDNTPEVFERAFPGLTSFGSAAASARDQDGICALHELHLGAESSCASYTRARR